MKSIPTAVCLCMLILPLSAARAAPGDQPYERPGRLVNAGNTELNLYCMGSGSPTVIFDAGLEDWSPAWAKIQPAISRYTRACSYDRAGSGFSAPGPMPRTSAEIARELHAALHNGRIPGPYLLVAHSFGGYNLRAFADMYMPEVFGAVFVDIESDDLESAGERAADNREFARAAKVLMQCRDAVANHRPLPAVPATADPSVRNMPCSRFFFDGLPVKQWPPQLNAIVLHVVDTRVALYDAVISELQEMPADARWLVKHRRSFGTRPIRILTAEDHFHDDDMTLPAVHRRHFALERVWEHAQHRLLLLSTDSKQVVLRDSGHYIQFERPTLVIEAIRSELAVARAHAAG